jgi:hypothetical protein
MPPLFFFALHIAGTGMGVDTREGLYKLAGKGAGWVKASCGRRQ